MGISELIERLGRAVFEMPFGGAEQAGDSPEIAEIRFAILDEIRARMQRAAGKHIFPYDLVRIQIHGVGDSQSAIFEREFFRSFFQNEVRRALDKEHCRYPDDLLVQVQVTKSLPETGKWLTIETTAQATPPPAIAPTRPSASLTVLSGTANVMEFALEKNRVNVGRVSDVYRAAGPSRRNDIVFAEETQVNRTVSREHAHILWDDAAREYRLYNDRWYKRDGKPEGACNLWIMREGLGQEVHRDTRGTRLQNGDEIHFGKAVLQFTIS
jgi:pSer/pThr/pTyr-binding forkhead associated (FHA) protein